MSISKQSFIGTWRLADCASETPNGRADFSLGPNVIGLLVYDEKGNMAAQMMSTDRERLSSSNPVKTPAEEYKKAFLGFVSYFGEYTLDLDRRTVTHHVKGASAPNWVGRDQLRFFDLVDDRLTLRTPPVTGTDGVKAVQILVWERA